MRLPNSWVCILKKILKYMHLLCIPAKSTIKMTKGVEINGLPSLSDVKVNAADLVDIADVANETRVADETCTADVVDAADITNEANAADKATIADLADAADLAEAADLADSADLTDAADAANVYDSSNEVSIPYIGMAYVGVVGDMSNERLNVEIINSTLELIL